MKLMNSLFSAAVILAAASTTAIAAEPIKLGAFLSITGPISFIGDPEKKVMEHYVDRLNKEGGLLGRKVELTIYDDAGAADKAVSFVKRLIENDKVDMIIGGSVTSTTMAIVPQIERAEIPYISLGAAIAITEPVKKWVFKANHSDRMVAEKVVEDMKKRGFTKIALIGEDTGFSKSGMAQTQEVAKSYGVEIVASEIFNPRDPDITPQLTRVKTASGAQAIFIWAVGQSSVMASKNYKQLGMTTPLYQSHAVGTKDFLRLAGDSADGIRFPGTALSVGAALAPTDPQRPVVLSFTKIFEDTFKADVSVMAGTAHDGLQLALAAIHRAGSTDKAKIRDELEKTSGYVGANGTYTYTATDHAGLNLNSFHMLEIKGGNWHEVK